MIISLTSNVLSDYLVFDDVAAAIIKEENRCSNREDRQTCSRQVDALVVMRGRSMEPGSSGSHNHGKSKTRRKKNFKCYKCGKSGHFKKDCWSLNTSNPQGNVASTLEDDNTLYCEATVANEGRGGSAYSCNDHELNIIGIGSIMVEIQNKIMKIMKCALILMREEKVVANLYQMKGEIIEEAEASVASHSLSYRVEVTWHQKLGHMLEQGMKILVERKLLPGLTMISLPFYEHCVISKQHCLKFKTSNSKSVSVLELVYYDVWQAPVQSLGGAKYFVYFIDDHSRRCWVYPIKKKSDVFEVFKVYKARVELDSRNKIKCLRTDNLGEYTRDEFVKLKTPMEMWTGKLVYYSDLHIFGIHVYMMYKFQENIKLDLKSKKCLFLRYADGVMGYHLWEPTAYKMEKQFQSNDSSKVVPQHEENETTESQASTTRTLNRERKRPAWHSDYVMKSNVAYCLLT
ncbi:gag-pol polyprotein [Tanacetum coccineum]